MQQGICVPRAQPATLAEIITLGLPYTIAHVDDFTYPHYERGYSGNGLYRVELTTPAKFTEYSSKRDVLLWLRENPEHCRVECCQLVIVWEHDTSSRESDT
jgi:hypothetical protein